ncbi:MAG: alpha/beta fold hydrolase [Candidatus Hodarchaeota archaeon]
MEHRQVMTNGINLHVVQDGPSTGRLVIFLHGFPEFWYGWRHQIPQLASAGYRVWVPDQRGYNLSDKPDGIAAYTLDELGADVIGLIDVAGQETAIIVGHDWGAAVAWWVAAKYPSRLARMVIINVPHGAVLTKHLRSNFAQIRKSWYMFFFQLPSLPEFLIKLQNWNMLVQALRNSSRPGTFTNSDLDRYRQAWSQPKALTSMLNWYRSVMQKPPTPPDNLRITVPTLLIWGVQDKFLGRELAQPSLGLCDDGHLVFFEEATHWVHHEEAERVNDLIDTFMQSGSNEFISTA